MSVRRAEADRVSPASLRTVTPARNLMLPLRLRIRRFLRDSFMRTVTTPGPGTVKRLVPRLTRRLALIVTLFTEENLIVPSRPAPALKLKAKRPLLVTLLVLLDEAKLGGGGGSAVALGAGTSGAGRGTTFAGGLITTERVVSCVSAWLSVTRSLIVRVPGAV